MKIRITNNSKKVLTVAEMPIVKAIIEDFKEDVSVEEYAAQAAENPSLIISENMKQGKANQSESAIVGVCVLKQSAENINEAGYRIVSLH